MTYSCAVFEPGDTLETAQRRKYEALAELADVGPAHDVLEIGTGWGGMAIHAGRDARLPGHVGDDLAGPGGARRERIAAAGLGDLIDVVLCDYREIEGTLRQDRLGRDVRGGRRALLADLLRHLRPVLRPGGAVGMQTITMPAPPLPATRRTYGWVHKYIFPGGLIPSREAIDRAVRSGSGLRVEPCGEIGPLLRDHAADVARAVPRPADEVAALGFDGTFRRMWEFYLAYCEAGFAHGRARQRPAAAGAAVRLGGRRVWVTGASSGIGAALVRELVRRGCRWRPAPAAPTGSRSSGRACWPCRSTSPTATR